MSVPPRWTNCPRKGKIVADKFLPFKTPLGQRYDGELEEACRFKPDMLLQFMEGVSLKLGMVVDLTKTCRFYDRQDFEKHKIGHYKLQCEGFGEAPNREQVNEFKQIARRFFSTHPKEILGIHCTHGYNRTGFLIISYLVEVEDWSLECAISTFAKARPPGIYKEGYLKELTERYKGDMADITVPLLPDWCNEAEEEKGAGRGGAPGLGQSSEGAGEDHRKIHRGELQKENAQFVSGVHGVTVVEAPLREGLQRECQAILGWEGSGFPGSQPVSMDQKNIALLEQKKYRVSWKADGTRYMMYIKGKGEVYMLDRDNSVFRVANLTFPARKRPGGHVENTLIDGEMVEDRDRGRTHHRYLMYDIMQFEGCADIAKCNHELRLFCVEKELKLTRDNAMKEGRLDKELEPFSVRTKRFWDVSHTQWVIEEFVKQLTHENDGLIFSPFDDPYKPGQCPELMKWKPPELNSVDFRLNIMEQKREGMLPEKIGCLFAGGMRQAFATMDLTKNRQAKQHDGGIIECTFVPRWGWKFLRVRTDKSFPNSFDTVQSVCHSINFPVTKAMLLSRVERWKAAGNSSGAGGGRKRPAAGEGDMPPPKIPPPRTK